MNMFFIAAAVNIAFCIFIFFYFKWYIKHRTTVNELLSEYRNEVYRLNAEIDSKTDRDSRLVEDRINKLKAILEDTDKRISVYVRELERSRSAEALYTNLGKGIRAALNTSEKKSPANPAAEVSSAAPLTPVSVQKAGNEVLQFPGKEKNSRNKSAEERLIESQSSIQIRSRVEALVKEGLSVTEIASRLDISRAEADLAVNLFSLNKK
jgi:predicted DNA-binding protein YlxM (UPF0122 family)